MQVSVLTLSCSKQLGLLESGNGRGSGGRFCGGWGPSVEKARAFPAPVGCWAHWLTGHGSSRAASTLKLSQIRSSLPIVVLVQPPKPPQHGRQAAQGQASSTITRNHPSSAPPRKMADAMDDLSRSEYPALLVSSNRRNMTGALEATSSNLEERR